MPGSHPGGQHLTILGLRNIDENWQRRGGPVARFGVINFGQAVSATDWARKSLRPIAHRSGTLPA